MKTAKLYIAILFFATGILFSAEDIYHQAIRSQLAGNYNISGGTWILYDSEVQANEKIQLLNVTSNISAWPGDEPFSSIVEVNVDDIRINPWDQAIRLNTTAPVQKGDALLLIIWMNNADVLAQKHAVTHVFEATNSPFEKSLYLDGEIKSGWRQWIIPFEAETDYAAHDARFQINLGHMKGELHIAGVAMLNFGAQYSVDDLPTSTHHLEYDGRESNASWRSEALTRINQIRKDDLRIRVFNKFNEPIQGANINVRMQKHEFGFGTAVSSSMWFDESYDSQIYLQKLKNLTGDGRSFNIVAIENALKWTAWENPHEQGKKEQVAQVAEWLADRDIRIRGHNLLWPNWEYMPADMQENQNDPAYLATRIQSHIYEQARYNGIKGIINEWDVINETGICHDLINALNSDAIYADVLKWTAQSDANAKLFLNENNIIANGGLKKTSREQYKALIEKLTFSNTPLHGIGIQGHMSTSLTAPETILKIFDEFKSYDLEISITEYDAVDINEELAADYMRDILITAFSHESVNSFIMWGFWDGAHWKGDSPIFRRDWSVKPSGEAFINWVFRNWWTNVDGKSSENGGYSTRAFYGDYAIVVDFDGQKTEALVDFSNQSKEIILHIDTEFTSAQLPTFYRLEQNYPNPFNGTTTIQYELPFRDKVVVDLFDVQGRFIKQLINTIQPAGRHALQIDSADFPSGLFYYRLQSGKFRQTKKMLLIK
jgi:endo-1,4-beta-xylanase